MVTVIKGGSEKLSVDNLDKLLIEITVDAQKGSLEANKKILATSTHARAHSHLLQTDGKLQYEAMQRCVSNFTRCAPIVIYCRAAHNVLA